VLSSQAKHLFDEDIKPDNILVNLSEDTPAVVVDVKLAGCGKHRNSGMRTNKLTYHILSYMRRIARRSRH
jgi:hypothetical protein